ncbi:MAG: hypothetical protein RLZZ73_905, partial [Actinomycetota bacterium]
MREPSSIFESVFSVAQSSGKILSEFARPDDDAENPILENPRSMVWPRDVLGDRRDEFDAVMESVSSATAHLLKASEDAEINSWIEDAVALLNEERASKSQSIEIPLPSRLSTSTLVRLHQDKEALALDIRRPMPRTQDEYSRRGTAFHLWIEHHFNAATLFSDDDLDFLDPLEDDAKLEDLKSKWLESEWANRTPFAVEVPFESVINGVLVRGRI